MENKSKKILSEGSAGVLLDKISLLEIKLEKSSDKNKEEKKQIIQDFNTYLIFLEKYFSDENAKPLKKGNYY